MLDKIFKLFSNFFFQGALANIFCGSIEHSSLNFVGFFDSCQISQIGKN